MGSSYPGVLAYYTCSKSLMTVAVDLLSRSIPCALILCLLYVSYLFLLCFLVICVYIVRDFKYLEVQHHILVLFVLSEAPSIMCFMKRVLNE